MISALSVIHQYRSTVIINTKLEKLNSKVPVYITLNLNGIKQIPLVRNMPCPLHTSAGIYVRLHTT